MARCKLSALIVTSLAAASLFATGCNNDRLTVGELRRNPTPELSHLARSNGQVRNDHARVWDHNMRALKDDIDRALWMSDSPDLQPLPAP